ncbi:MAG: tetratricopeptide repeat protein [Chitinophagaceae bacterium]|nr:tetratricopeptide repeat protein [Chitinophagaceae bacterium]
MKPKLLLLAGLAFLAASFAFSIKQNKKPSYQAFDLTTYKNKNLVRCSPDWELLKDWIEETDIPPIPGAGNYSWKITTTSDSAQFYFNQGINMYYSFHIIEAMASFKKAARFDPNSGMLYWAQALAYGPNINDLGYAASPDALEAAGKSIEFCNTCTEKETLLIRAQRSRYSADSTESRVKLNQVYVDLMKEAYDQFPDDADVAALYADALMLQHPWDLWKIDGTPKPWTPLIRDVLEKLLAKTPGHPGANHYYIHVMEPSPYADKALSSADRLGKLTPGLSHTVHMPSHIYLRTGHYNKGVSVNEDAVNSYKKSIALYAPVTGADFLYAIHNLHMQTNNAMLGGMLAYSIRSAKETVESIPKDYLGIPGAMGNYVQYIYMTPVLVDIRFGRWTEILNRPQPEASMIYVNVLYHFSKGMAYAYQKNMTEASKELDLMREFMKDSSLNIPLSPFSAAIEGAMVAEQLLLGVIHEQRKLYDGAIRHFKMADSIEQNMVYNEPRDWILNPKHYLGNAYVLAGRYKEAEQAFLDDLKYNNENGWALYGLYQSLSGQKKKGEADKAMIRFRKAFDKTDSKISSSVF